MKPSFHAVFNQYTVLMLALVAGAALSHAWELVANR